MKCAEEADGCVKYIPPLNHIELASAYCAASIHVQPSWFETVGLSSLEAAATGTPIVTTVQGAAQEYFGDKAIYVEPDSLESIRTGVLTAMKQSTEIEQNNKNATPKSERNMLEIKTYIKDRFTWDKTAKNTLEAYEQVLADDEIKVNESFYSQTYKLPELE